MTTPLKALIQERLRAKIVRQGDEETTILRSYEDDGSIVHDPYQLGGPGYAKTTGSSAAPLIDPAEYELPRPLPVHDSCGPRHSLKSQRQRVQRTETSTRRHHGDTYSKQQPSRDHLDDHVRTRRTLYPRYASASEYSDSADRKWSGQSTQQSPRHDMLALDRPQSLLSDRHTYQRDADNQEDDTYQHHDRYSTDVPATSDVDRRKSLKFGRYQPYRTISKRDSTMDGYEDYRDRTVTRSFTRRAGTTIHRSTPEDGTWYGESQSALPYHSALYSSSPRSILPRPECDYGHVPKTQTTTSVAVFPGQSSLTRLAIPQSGFDYGGQQSLYRYDSLVGSTSKQLECIQLHDDILSPGSHQSAKDFVEKRQKRTTQGTPRTMATQRWLESIAHTQRVSLPTEAHRDNQDDSSYDLYHREPRAIAHSSDSPQIQRLPHSPYTYTTIV